MKAIQHLKTINKHKYYVTKLCFKCGLYKQGLKHDLSKYSYTELKSGFKYFAGDRSPNAVEREATGYSLAWLHHKGRNKHHWEYWVDFSSKGTVAARMPTNYVVEMFCDRVAATMVYRGKNYDNSAPLDYYNRTKHYYVLHQDANRELQDMLTYLAKHSLDDTIKYIRREYLHKFKD